MELRCIASGSKGNAYTVSDGESVLLLEAGIPFSSLQAATGFRLHSLAGCLLSHAHADHARAAEKLLSVSVDVFTSRGTAEALSLRGHRLHPVRAKEPFRAGSFDVLPFAVVHDAPEPLGFLLRSGKTMEKLVFFTDTARVDYRFRAVHYILGECNYDGEILRRRLEDGSLSPDRYKRLIQTHTGLEDFLDFLKDCDLRETREVCLLHLSDDHSDEKRFREAVTAALPSGVNVKIY